MARPKKEIGLSPEGTGKEPEIKFLDVDLKELLKKKMPSCFDREPASAFNSNLDKLVEDIIKLCC